jgi:hypothetical protein
MNVGLPDLVEVVTIVTAVLTVIVTVVIVPPKFNEKFDRDNSRANKAGQELADEFKNSSRYSIERALTEYLEASLLLEGFYLWRGLGLKVRVFRRLEQTAIATVAVSGVLLLVYWGFSGMMSDDAKIVAANITTASAIASLIVTVFFICVRRHCENLYSTRRAHLEQ